MDRIVCFKLISGDEIIGKVNCDSPDEIIIEKPFMVVPTQNGNVMFLQAMISSSQSAPITFLKSAMAIKPMDTSAEFDKVYREKTSGLILGQG